MKFPEPKQTGNGYAVNNWGTSNDFPINDGSSLKKGMKPFRLQAGRLVCITEAVHGNARILNIDTAEYQAQLRSRKVVVVAGFQGVDENGEITTLGRGGSDTTAVALAAALKADRCDIYTDVTGVFTTDPRYIKDARKLQSVSYDEMLELANLGAGVLHPRAVNLQKIIIFRLKSVQVWKKNQEQSLRRKQRWKKI